MGVIMTYHAKAKRIRNLRHKRQAAEVQQARESIKPKPTKMISEEPKDDNRDS